MAVAYGVRIFRLPLMSVRVGLSERIFRYPATIDCVWDDDRFEHEQHVCDI